MSEFNITETFTRNNKVNVHKYQNFVVTDFYKWEGGPYINVSNDTFPDLDENYVNEVPSHMIIQIRDDISNRDGLLSVVKGYSSEEEYDKLFKRIKNYFLNPNGKFLYEYEITCEGNTYKYMLEMEKCNG